MSEGHVSQGWELSLNYVKIHDVWGDWEADASEFEGSVQCF